MRYIIQYTDKRKNDAIWHVIHECDDLQNAVESKRRLSGCVDELEILIVDTETWKIID